MHCNYLIGLTNNKQLSCSYIPNSSIKAKKDNQWFEQSFNCSSSEINLIKQKNFLPVKAYEIVKSIPGKKKIMQLNKKQSNSFQNTFHELRKLK